LNRQSARDVACLVPPHSVGDGEQAHGSADGSKHRGKIERQQAILVQRSFLSHVGPVTDDVHHTDWTAEFLERAVECRGEVACREACRRGARLIEDRRHPLGQLVTCSLLFPGCQVEKNRPESLDVLGNMTRCRRMIRLWDNKGCAQVRPASPLSRYRDVVQDDLTYRDVVVVQVM
jgi:hypothetical protein